MRRSERTALRWRNATAPVCSGCRALHWRTARAPNRRSRGLPFGSRPQVSDWQLASHQHL